MFILFIIYYRINFDLCSSIKRRTIMSTITFSIVHLNKK